MRIPVQDKRAASLHQIAATRENSNRSLLLAAKISLRGLDAPSNHEKARQRFSVDTGNNDHGKEEIITKPSARKSSWIKPVPTWEQQQQQPVGEPNQEWKKSTSIIVSNNIWKQKDKLMAESNSRSNIAGVSPRKWKNLTPQGEFKFAPSSSAAPVSSVPKWKKPETPSSSTFPTKDSSTTSAPVKKWKKPTKSVTLPLAAMSASNVMVSPAKWKRPSISVTANDTKEVSSALPSMAKAPIRVWKNHTAVLADPSTVKDSNVDAGLVKKWKKPATVEALGNESVANRAKTPIVVKKWKRPQVEAVTEQSVTEPSSHFQNSVAKFNNLSATDPNSERRNSIDNNIHNEVPTHKSERSRRRSSMNNAVSSTFGEKGNYSNTFQVPAVVKKSKRPEPVAKPLGEKDNNTNASTAPKKWKRPEAAKQAVEPSTEKVNKPAAFEKWKKLTEAPREGPSPEIIKKTGNVRPTSIGKKWKNPPVAESWTRNDVNNVASPVTVQKWSKPTVVKSTMAPVDAKVTATLKSKKDVLSKPDSSPSKRDCKTPVQTPNNIQSSPTSVIRPEISQLATAKQLEEYCIVSPKPDEETSKLESTRKTSKWMKSELLQLPQIEATPKLQEKLAVATANVCVEPSKAKKATTTESRTENTRGTPFESEKEMITAKESIGENGSMIFFESEEAKITTTESIAKTDSVTSFESEEKTTIPIESKEETSSVAAFESSEGMATPKISKAQTSSVASFESDEEMSTPIESKAETSSVLQSVPALPSLPPELRVDGNPLDHWDTSNFDKKRDHISRIVLEPKDGEAFYQEIFDDHAYEILRKTSIEQPYFSKYNRFFPVRGHFCCKACGNALYDWTAKFDAENGWPAFGACVRGSLEVSTEPTALGEGVDEIHCLKCRSHVGNVVLEDNWGKRGVRFRERHRVNGRSLKYIATDLGKRTTTNHTLLYHKEGSHEPVRSFFG